MLAERWIVLLTELDMYEKWQKEIHGGRVLDNIEFVNVELPIELDARLKGARKKASDEVSIGHSSRTPDVMVRDMVKG